MTIAEFVEVWDRCRASRAGYKIGSIKIDIDTIADIAPPILVSVGKKFVIHTNTLEKALAAAAEFMEEAMREKAKELLKP